MTALDDKIVLRVVVYPTEALTILISIIILGVPLVGEMPHHPPQRKSGYVSVWKKNMT